MSLGWQTESALLPSKAKPIHVDSKSLLQLKSLISQQEQLRKEDDLTGKRRRTFKQKSSKDLIEPDKYSKNASNLSNSSIEELALDVKVQKSLEAKAKLYDEMLRKNGDNDSEHPLLIDFDEKRKIMQQLSHEDEGKEEEENEKETTINVSHNPSNTSQYSEPIRVTTEYGPEQWQWSKGNPTRATKGEEQEEERDNFSREWKAEKEFKSLVDHRINEELRQTTSSNTRPEISEAARIKTQWEKTLQSNARVYLEEVHQKTEQERMTSSSNKRSLREEKLEMIKRKRMEQQKR